MTTSPAGQQLVRVHNLGVSLDGYATGDGQSLQAPFGHAGQRLHEWFFDTAMFREMQGGTVFHFRDASPQDVLAEAKKAADGLDVRIGGGPTVVRDFLAADLVDHLHVVIVPIVLGRGVRLWDGLEGLEQRFDVETAASPTGVSHVIFSRRTS